MTAHLCNSGCAKVRQNKIRPFCKLWQWQLTRLCITKTLATCISKVVVINPKGISAISVGSKVVRKHLFFCPGKKNISKSFKDISQSTPPWPVDNRPGTKGRAALKARPKNRFSRKASITCQIQSLHNLHVLDVFFFERFDKLQTFPPKYLEACYQIVSFLAFPGWQKSRSQIHRIASAIQSAPPPARLALEPTLQNRGILNHLGWVCLYFNHLATLGDSVTFFLGVPGVFFAI